MVSSGDFAHDKVGDNQRHADQKFFAHRQIT
jgi:hypothetical protein